MVGQLTSFSISGR